MILAAFDLATSTGVCWGEPGQAPRFITWNLREGGEGRPMRLLYLMRLLRAYLDAWPDANVVYEAPQPIRVLGRLGTSELTIALLRGAVGVLEGTCAEYGRPVEALNVQDARESVLGWRTNPRGSKRAEKTKARVIRELGQFHQLYPQTEDEADATVLWLYACARLNPRIAVGLTPLFKGEMS